MAFPIELQVANLTVNEGGSVNAIGLLIYDDSSTAIVPVTITPQAPMYGTWLGQQFTANQVSGTRIQNNIATYREPEFGNDYVANFTVTIRDLNATPVLTSISLDGPETVNKATTQTYNIVGHYSNGTTAILQGSLTTNRPSVASIAGNQVTFSSVYGSVVVRLTGSYQNLSTSLDVTVADNTVYPTELRIHGPNRVNTDKRNRYAVVATFADGTKREVRPSYWQVTGDATLEGNDLIMLPGAVRLVAQYRVENVVRSAHLDVTGFSPKAYPVATYIDGPSKVSRFSTHSYRLVRRYSDGGLDVLQGTWESGPVIYASDLEPKTLQVTFEGERYSIDVTVLDRTPSQISIGGPTQVNVKEPTQLTCLAVFQSIEHIRPDSWSVKGDATLVDGVFVANEAGTYPVTVRCDDLEFTQNIEAFHLKDRFRNDTLRIRGPRYGNKGSYITYTAEVQRFDGVYVNVFPVWNVLGGRIKLERNITVTATFNGYTALKEVVCL